MNQPLDFQGLLSPLGALKNAKNPAKYAGFFERKLKVEELKFSGNVKTGRSRVASFWGGWFGKQIWRPKGCPFWPSHTI